MTKRTLEQIEAEVEAAVDALRRLTDEDIDILEGSHREFVFRMASALGQWDCDKIVEQRLREGWPFGRISIHQHRPLFHHDD